jgi:hypothetical protein
MRTGTAVSRSCMAVNQWRSAHVRSKREGQTADPVDEIEQWLTRHELTEALAQLSMAHREILVAAFVHDRALPGDCRRAWYTGRYSEEPRLSCPAGASRTHRR